MDNGVDQVSDDATQDASGVAENPLGGREFRGAVEHREPGAPELKPAPDGIPEKFWDPVEGKLRQDDLLKSYTELSKKLGAPKDETEEATEETEEVTEETTDETSDEGADEGSKEGDDEGEDDGAGDVADAELSAALTDAQAAYAEAGELSAEAREPLLKAGITNEQIDFYIAGVKATEMALQSAAAEAAGSQEDLEAAMAWAAKAWANSPKKAQAFNAQMGDVETIKLAVPGLMKEFRSANPSEGRLTQINSSVTHGDVYTSMEEFTQDLDKADKLRDKVARSKAIAKLRRSREAGTVKSERRSPFGG